MTKIFTLSVDTLGSETELNDILKGLNQSLLRNLNYKFQLYGPEEIIKKKIEKYKRLIKVTEIIDCDSYITMEDKPSDILKSKKNKEHKNRKKMLTQTPFSDPVSCPVLFLSQFILPGIVVQLASVVLVFFCSQPVCVASES